MIETHSNKKLSNIHKYMIIGIGILFIGSALYDGEYLKILFGLVLIYASFFEKSIFIEEDGLLIQIKKLGKESERRIKFTEMSEINIHRKNDKAMIFFIKENIGHKVIIDLSNLEETIKLAKKQNKKIQVDYLS
ncbi:hypothetical protein [Inediibacterium massiliense]|uniref:hypothetical protein n=1 Tax=Inediibacterium massiliense TaxID=1658111 RepID=UPI0006B5833D|nr:hypothetical protein [Inediibacterium massiliense]